MTYVISDLHGAYEEFILMLKKINFTDNDLLYINGDIIDRENGSIKIIDYILDKKNIIWIKGNHEELLEYSFENEEYNLWFCNGGYSTYTDLYNKPENYVKSLLQKIKNLPLYKIHNNFIITHAGVLPSYDTEFLDVEAFLEEQDNHTLLWDRSSINDDIGFYDYKFIFGHTPTISISNGTTNKILYKNNKIYIDCGISTSTIGKLGCLCLETMEEFYIDRK